MFRQRKNFIIASIFQISKTIVKLKTILNKSTTTNENAEIKAKSKIVLYVILGGHLQQRGSCNILYKGLSRTARNIPRACATKVKPIIRIIK